MNEIKSDKCTTLSVGVKLFLTSSSSSSAWRNGQSIIMQPMSNRTYKVARKRESLRKVRIIDHRNTQTQNLYRSLLMSINTFDSFPRVNLLS